MARSLASLASSLVVATPTDDGEPGLGLHPGADGPRDLGPGAVEAADAGDVEERLVERDGLDQRRERAQDRHDLGAHVAVERRTAARGTRRRARRVAPATIGIAE